MGYTIDFENLGEGSEVKPPGQPLAEVPAILVTIETELDADVDVASFALGDVGFGDTVIDVPDGRQAYSTRLGPIADPAATGGEIYVDVDGSLDLSSEARRVGKECVSTWRYRWWT